MQDAFHLLMLLLLLITIVGTVVSTSLGRFVSGSMASLFDEAGINFTVELAYADLPFLIARQGGFLFVMAATFALFIIVGPVLRQLWLTRRL